MDREDHGTVLFLEVFPLGLAKAKRLKRAGRCAEQASKHFTKKKKKKRRKVEMRQEKEMVEAMFLLLGEAGVFPYG